MPDVPNSEFALTMTVFGMGTVFALLALLWLLLNIMLRFDREPVREQPTDEEFAADDTLLEDTNLPVATAQPQINILTEGLDPDTLAAVTVAILTHIKVRHKQGAPVSRRFAPGSHLFASHWIAVGRALQNQAWRRR